MCHARKPRVAMIGVAITGLPISKYLPEDVTLASAESSLCWCNTEISVKKLG